MPNLFSIFKGEAPEQVAYGRNISGQCSNCEHRDPTGAIKCSAFPEGIPSVIFFDAFDHTHPYDMDGVSDGGITFSLKEDPDAPSVEKVFAASK